MHRRTLPLPHGTALAVPLLVLTSSAARATAPANGYTITPISFLGEPAPGGGNFTNDSEPTNLNSKGAA